jgi:hypothetical protein
LGEPTSKQWEVTGELRKRIVPFDNEGIEICFRKWLFTIKENNSDATKEEVLKNLFPTLIIY